MSDKGFVLRVVKHMTAPMLVCESCGETITDFGWAWVVWDDVKLSEGKSVRPVVVCKKNGCNVKPPFVGYASMEMQEYLVNLCRNTGLKTEEQFREAFEFVELADQVG